MPVYDFTFPADAAGLAVSVVDINGTEFSSGTLGSTPNAASQIIYSPTLASGSYLGIVASQGLGQRNYPSPLVVVGVLNVASSFGGSGANLEGPYLTFEVNGGQDMPLDGGNLTWDTVPDGYTGGNFIAGLEPGVYSALLEIDFAPPAEDRLATLAISSTTNANAAALHGPSYIASGSSSWRGYTGMSAGVVVVADGAEVACSFRGDVVDSASSPTPADWSISYAGLFMTRFL